jgi:hypothetical protein
MVLRVVRMTRMLWIIFSFLKFKWSIWLLKYFSYENLVGNQILYFLEFSYYFFNIARKSLLLNDS